MKLKRILPAAAALLLVFGSAQAQQRTTTTTAQSPLYGELGYTWLQIDAPPGFEARPQALRGIIGYDLHPNVAVEGMAAFGTRSDSDLGVDVKLRNAWGVFAKPKYDFNNFQVFGRLGWVQNRTRASALGISVTDRDDDFAWGAGVNYSFSPRSYVGLDYMRYYDKGGSRIDGVTLGVGFRF